MIQIKLMANPRLLILRMLKGQLDAGDTFGGFILRADKDDITHRPAAELLGGRFTQHPANGINDVGFAAAVWPDYGGDTMTEGKSGWIGKGFKACQL